MSQKEEVLKGPFWNDLFSAFYLSYQTERFRGLKLLYIRFVWESLGCTQLQCTHKCVYEKIWRTRLFSSFITLHTLLCFQSPHFVQILEQDNGFCWCPCVLSLWCLIFLLFLLFLLFYKCAMLKNLSKPNRTTRVFGKRTAVTTHLCIRRQQDITPTSRLVRIRIIIRMITS